MLAFELSLHNGTEYFVVFQASSLSASAKGAADLINPSSLFQFSALKGLKHKGITSVQI